MRPWNPFATAFDGTLADGKAPVRLTVRGGELSGTDFALMQSAYFNFKSEQLASIVPYSIQHRRLSPTATARFVSLAGVDSVEITVAGGEDERRPVSGIGMRLRAWGGALIPELSEGGQSSYILVERDQAKNEWRAKVVPSLVAGEFLWVSEDRTRWITTAVFMASGIEYRAFSKNEGVGRGTLSGTIEMNPFLGIEPSGRYWIGALTATRSALQIKLTARNGSNFIERSIPTSDYGQVVRVFGTKALLAGTFDRRRRLLASIDLPMAIISETMLPGLPENTAGSGKGELTYSYHTTLKPSYTIPAPLYSTKHYSGAPDLETIYGPGPPGAIEGEYPWWSIFDRIIDEKRISFLPEVYHSGDTAWVGNLPGYGWWTHAAMVGSAQALVIPSSFSTASAAYTENSEGTGATIYAHVWDGVTHQGVEKSITKKETSRYKLDGEYDFTAHGFTCSKKAFFALENQFNMPNGGVLVDSISIEEDYSETATHDLIEAPASSAQNFKSDCVVLCRYQRTTHTLIHYDADNDVAVFQKVMVSGTGSFEWQKTSELPPGQVGQWLFTSSAFAESIRYRNTEVVSRGNFTSQTSILIFQNGAARFEERVLDAPASGARSASTPMAYSGINFYAQTSTGKQPGAASTYPFPTDVYGESAPYSFVNNHSYLLHMKEDSAPAMLDFRVATQDVIDRNATGEVQTLALRYNGDGTYEAPTGDLFVVTGGGGTPLRKLQLNQDPIEGSVNAVVEWNNCKEQFVSGSQTQRVKTGTTANWEDQWDTGASLSFASVVGDSASISARSVPDARSGCVAIEVVANHHSFGDVPRSFIYLASPTEVIHLNQLIRPPSGVNQFAIDNFLKTI